MTQSSALKYNQLIIEANRLGRRMKLLEQATLPNRLKKPGIDQWAGGNASSHVGK